MDEYEGLHLGRRRAERPCLSTDLVSISHMNPLVACKRFQEQLIGLN